MYFLLLNRAKAILLILREKQPGLIPTDSPGGWASTFRGRMMAQLETF